MKHLMTLMALVVAVTAGAQTSIPTAPYNPDSDMDGIITVADLMSLLTLFSTEFSAYTLSLTSDSSMAALYVGQLDYFDCRVKCDTVQGNWKVLELDNYGYFRNDLDSLQSNGQYAWLNHGWVDNNKVLAISLIYDSPDEIASTNPYNCVCQTEVMPQIQYDLCSTEGEATFVQCVEEKLSEGWLPIGGVSRTQYNAYPKFSQAFWRWAE